MVAVPITVVPWRKSTFAMVPLAVVAEAAMVRLAGSATTVLFAGLVISTARELFCGTRPKTHSFPDQVAT